jgi:uncharacterized glyoxalase superfamily protein PhnB
MRVARLGNSGRCVKRRCLSAVQTAASPRTPGSSDCFAKIEGRVELSARIAGLLESLYLPMREDIGFEWEVRGMVSRVTSVFLYVNDMVKSIDFYHEVVGAEIRQVHTEQPGGPIGLALLRIGDFTLMLHPQDPHSDEFKDQKVGLGIHLQIRVDDVDAFHQHCLEQGALLSVSGEPMDQNWGWREFALKDPDGYVWSIYQDNSNGQWTT